MRINHSASRTVNLARPQRLEAPLPSRPQRAKAASKPPPAPAAKPGPGSDDEVFGLKKLVQLVWSLVTNWGSTAGSPAEKDARTSLAVERLKAAPEPLSERKAEELGLMKALAAQEKALGGEWSLPTNKSDRELGEALVLDGRWYVKPELLVNDGKMYVMAHVPTGDAYLDTETGGGDIFFFPVGEAP